MENQIPMQYRNFRRCCTFGPAETPRDSLMGKVAYRVGELLAHVDIIDVNGGQDGTMEWTSEGCNKTGGQVIGVLRYHGSRRNDFITIPVRCDIGDEEMRPYCQGMPRRTGVLISLGDGYILYFDYRCGHLGSFQFDPGTVTEYSAVSEYGHNLWQGKGLARPVAIICEEEFLLDAQNQVVAPWGRFDVVRNDMFDEWNTDNAGGGWRRIFTVEKPEDVDVAVNYIYSNVCPEITRGT